MKATITTNAVPIAAALLWLATSGAGAQTQPMRVHFIDAGQGAATLIEFPCGTMLIDSGGEATTWKVDGKERVYGGSDAVVGYLQGFFSSRSDRRLDLLVITHPHLDHTSGVPNILSQFEPRNVVHNGKTSGSGIAGQQAAEDFAQNRADVERWKVFESTIPDGQGLTNAIIDPIACSGVDPRIRVLWGNATNDSAWHSSEFGDGNNHSVVVRIDYGERSILFTGDLEESEKGKKAGIERLLEKYAGTVLLDAEVYHVGHHGSANGNSSPLTEAVSPQIAVLSHGPACDIRTGFSAWGHGHPRKETIDELLGCRRQDGQPCLSARTPPIGVQIYDKGPNPWKTEVVNRAIYSTGWDGTIVLEATPTGGWSIATTSGPDACLFD